MSRAAYSFQSQPHAVTGTAAPRAKYRPYAKPRDPAKLNLMNDRRVVRGNTHAVIVTNPFNTFQPPKPLPKRVSNVRRRQRQLASTVESIPSTAPQEEDLEEEIGQYEELEFDPNAAIQDNNEYEEKRPEPVFVPKPAGVNQSTSIEDEFIFDFEMSVEPVLEVLVGKALDQSIAEVLEERETRYLEQKRMKYDVTRTVAFASVEALKQECVRRNEERHRRLRQERDLKIKQRIIAHKVSSRQSTAAFLDSLQSQVQQNLEKRGVFFDPTTEQVQNTFVPWLLLQVQDKLQVVADTRYYVDQLIGASLEMSQLEVEEDKNADIARAALEQKKFDDVKAVQRYIIEETQARKEQDEQYERDLEAYYKAERERKLGGIDTIQEEDPEVLAAEQSSAGDDASKEPTVAQ